MNNKSHILIINCHWNNRGDEAAIRAMIDELSERYPQMIFYVQRATGNFDSFPQMPRVIPIPCFPAESGKKALLDKIAIITNGYICLTEGAKQFYKVLKSSLIVIHAPGGPSIGDLYQPQEITKLNRLLAVKNRKVPYVFFAPSMGPFKMAKRNPLRKEVIEHSSIICLREEISMHMVQQLCPTVKPIVTLDSAFQHDINLTINHEILERDEELKEFLSFNKVIGITITDLQWNNKYKNDVKIANSIRTTFTSFINYLINEGYRILFIPQLFGKSNDRQYMQSFCRENCYVMTDQYDCYFQQYIIGLLSAVVGMRYHSNIFSAKMGTPFISISYEQKMKGFMEKAKLEAYCIDINMLSCDLLIERFNYMISTLSDYKIRLLEKHNTFKSEAHKTTDLTEKLIDSIIERRNKL